MMDSRSQVPKRLAATVLLLLVVTIGASQTDLARGAADTSPGPHVRLRSVPLRDVRWAGGFWAQRVEQNRRVVVPNLWRVMQLPDNAATFHDLRMAASLAPKGKPSGRKWSDGDCHKCIETMAYLFEVTGDRELDRWMDEPTDIVAQAQQPDGYRPSWVH